MRLGIGWIVAYVVSGPTSAVTEGRVLAHLRYYITYNCMWRILMLSNVKQCILFAFNYIKYSFFFFHSQLLQDYAKTDGLEYICPHCSITNFKKKQSVANGYSQGSMSSRPLWYGFPHLLEKWRTSSFLFVGFICNHYVLDRLVKYRIYKKNEH